MQLFALIMRIRVNNSLEASMKTSLPPGDCFPSSRLANQKLHPGYGSFLSSYALFRFPSAQWRCDQPAQCVRVTECHVFQPSWSLQGIWQTGVPEDDHRASAWLAASLCRKLALYFSLSDISMLFISRCSQRKEECVLLCQVSEILILENVGKCLIETCSGVFLPNQGLLNC